MKVVFYLKGAARIDWPVLEPEKFNFQVMVKVIRADGQFLADGLYIQASEIAAIRFLEDDEHDEEEMPKIAVHHPGKVRRLVS